MSSISEVSATGKEHLATIVEHAPAFVGICNLDLRCEYVNLAGRAMCGIDSADDVTSLRIDDFHDPDSLAILANLIRDLKPGDTVQLENHLKTPRNPQTPVSQIIIAHPAPEDPSTIGFYSTIMQDVSGRRIYEGQLKLLNRSLSEVVKQIPGAVIVYGPNRRIQFASKIGGELIKHLKCKPDTDFPEKLSNALENALNSPDSSADEEHHTPEKDSSIELKIGGETRHFIPKIVPLRQNPEAGTTGVILTLTDVTQLHQLDAEKTDLIGAVSHELKTPIAAVQLPLMLMLEGKLDDSPRDFRTLLESMKNEVDRMNRTVLGLLDLTRFDISDHTLQFAEVQLEELIQSAIDHSESEAQRHGIKIRVTNQTPFHTIVADSDRLRTAIANLIGNAVKHSSEDHPVDITVENVETDGEIMISITDYGPGIPGKFVSRVFEKFFKVATNEKSGSGLGLSIARTFVEAHEGEIGVESVPGNTRFWIQIPVAPSNPVSNA